MPEGYKGLASYFEKEVEGDLTAEAASKWLADRGIQASSNDGGEAEVKEPSKATELQSVTDLGSAVAAAASATPEDSFQKSITEKAQELRGPGNLPELTAHIAALLGEE
jgi:hypothetical protein